MTDANGEYVKIYLYLLRCLGRDDFDFSVSAVAEHLGHTERDVMLAFTYWEKVGLLRLEYTPDNQLSGVCLVDMMASPSVPVRPSVTTPVAIAPAVTAPAVTAPAVVTPVSDHRSYTPDDLQKFSNEEGVHDLIGVITTYIGRPLSATESNDLLYWYDQLHMSTDLIEYLVESSIDKGHKSFHYMDKIARNWNEAGITSVEQARTESRKHNNIIYTIKSSMGISNRDLIEAELSYVKKWTSTYGFPVELIAEACQRTIIKTNSPSFSYADSILTSWYNSGVHTLADIARLDEQFVASAAARVTRSSQPRKRKEPFPQHDVDYDALAKKLMTT